MRETYEGKPCIKGHGTTRYCAGGACIVCSKDKSKERWRNGKKKKSKYDPVDRRARNLKANYGITIEQYNVMAVNQVFGCAICGSEPGNGSGKKFHVDHCHKTKKVRGLLCHTCNVGLGSFQDNPVKLAGAIEYLRKYGGI